MKRLLENFYLFSKLSTSLLLFSCLLVMGYIFYKSYTNQKNITNNQNVLGDIFKENIKSNIDQISDISNKLIANEKSLNEIENSINKIILQKNNDPVNQEINKKLNILSQDIQDLSLEINKLKNDDTSKNVILKSELNQNNTNNKTKKNLINLILLKYENGSNIQEELDMLAQILNSQDITKIEKIRIDLLNPYKGHDTLKKIFDAEMKSYIKKTQVAQSKNLFTKIIFSYVEITPTSENKIQNNNIILINKVEQNIFNNKILKAFQELQNVKNFNKYFDKSIDEIKIFLNFKKNILELG